MYSAKVPSFKVPSFENKVPSFENKVPSFENKVPSFENKVPSFENKVPSFEKAFSMDKVFCFFAIAYFNNGWVMPFNTTMSEEGANHDERTTEGC